MYASSILSVIRTFCIFKNEIFLYMLFTSQILRVIFRGALGGYVLILKIGKVLWKKISPFAFIFCVCLLKHGDIWGVIKISQYLSQSNIIKCRWKIAFFSCHLMPNRHTQRANSFLIFQSNLGRPHYSSAYSQSKQKKSPSLFCYVKPFWFRNY